MVYYSAVLSLLLAFAPSVHGQVARDVDGTCETTAANLYVCSETSADYSCFSTGVSSASYSTYSSVSAADTGFGLKAFNDSDVSLWEDMNATIANAADSNPIRGCAAPASSTAYANKLVFVERGNCSYFQKLLYGVIGGARAVIIYDTLEGTAMSSNFRLETGSSAPSDSDKERVKGVPIFGVSYRDWQSIHPTPASASAGQSFEGSASPGPRYFTLKCPSATDLSNQTQVQDQYTQLSSSSVFDTYDPIVYNVTKCPDEIVASYDCVSASVGCTAGYYCPYGNLPIEVTSPEVYSEVECNTSDPHLDETACCLTNKSTGIVECKCPLGFYCPVNTSQPLYCFEGFVCETPAQIKKCPAGEFCPYATVKGGKCLAFDICDEGSSKPNRWLLLVFVFIFFVLLRWLFLARASYLAIYAHRADKHLDDYHRDRTKRLERMDKAVKTMHANGELSDVEHARYREYHARQTAHHFENENKVRDARRVHSIETEVELHRKHANEGAVVIVVDHEGNEVASRVRSGIRKEALETAPVDDSKDNKEELPLTKPLGEIVQAHRRTSAVSELSDMPPVSEPTEGDTLIEEGADTSGPHDMCYDIEFENIGLTLPTGQTIMEGVSGRFSSGTCTAIMGPSGAGKTTVISLITGKYKKTHGKITVNGNVVNGLQKWKREVAFVPQEDVMHRDLSVRDNIMFNARLRLPRSWNNDEINEHVDWILDTLEIDHVQNTLVGDEKTRGVSGGQRKRVNIGMELASFPSIIFLDEPTSGLDSTTATELVELLKKLATAHHLTIASVIHAPTPKAFSQFDYLLLLQKGGRTAYFGEVGVGEIGPPCDLFSQLGYASKPVDEAEADYLLDVASGKVFRHKSQKELDEADGEHDITAADVFSAYKKAAESQSFDGTLTHHDIDPVEHGHRAHRRHLGIAGVASHYEHALEMATHSAYLSLKLWFLGVINMIHREFHAVFVAPIFPTEEDAQSRKTASTLTQFRLCMYRSYRQRVQSPGALLLKLLTHFVQGVSLSISLSYTEAYIGPFPYIFCKYGAAPALFLQCTHPYVETVAVSGMILSFTITFVAIGEGVNTFIDEKVVYWRECQAGLSTFAYYFGKVVVDLFVLWLSMTMFVAGYALNFPNSGDWGELYAIIFLMYLFGWAQGYVLSSICTKDSATLSAVAVSSLWVILLGGYQPRLPQVDEEYEGFTWLWELSGPRWTLEAFFINQLEYYHKNPHNSSQPYINQTTTYALYDFDRDNFDLTFRNIVLITLGWLMLGMIIMSAADRKKKN